MDTLSFLQKVLPAQGLYVLAAFFHGMSPDTPPAHKVCRSIEALAREALEIDAKGVQVFHACASFKEEIKKPKLIKGRSVMVQRTRQARNTAFVRSQWLDVDVGDGKDYANRSDAGRALAEACRTLHIPAPMIVGSGRGFHCYWPFTEDIPSDRARIMQAAFSAALKDVGFRHDPSRTTDLASVLRPVGTHWRKAGAVEVVLLRDAAPIDYARFAQVLSKYAPAAPIELDEWTSGPRSYPPSSALRIIQFCPAVAHVAKERGNVIEPLWRSMLGVVKHTTEGDALAHEWSAGHPRYSDVETQEKLDGWHGGPTTCAWFASLCDKCTGCAHAGLKSPIHLGYSEDAPPVAPAPPITAPAPPVVEQEDYRFRMPDKIPFWPPGYAWDGLHLTKAMKDDSGQVTWLPFSHKFFYPYFRWIAEDGTFSFKFCVLADPARNRWIDGEAPSKTVAEAGTLAAALGCYEVFATSKGTREAMKQFVKDMLDARCAFGPEAATHNAFGWDGDGFILGNTRLTGKGESSVLLGARVPDTCRGSIGTSGTAPEWAVLIDHIYNRPGAEPYQFLICAAFGAPLVKLVASDMWHGIPIALTGEGGLGKTTTCKVACSIFGPPDSFTVTTNEQGSTINALIARVATMRNLPLVLDEMTGRSTHDLQGMLYALSNGMPKLRLRSDGSQIGGDLTWDTISYVTGNVNITGLLAELDRTTAEASQMRCFEIALPPQFNSRVFAGINAKELIEGKLLAKQYGVVGREYLRHVICHRDKIAERLQKRRAAYNPNSQEEARERFYYDLVATALVGGEIAQKLGFLRFDLNALAAWAEQHVCSMRRMRRATTYSPEDYFQEFLASLHGRTLVTKWFSDGRVYKDRYVECVDERGLRDPIARHATEDRRFLVSVRGFNEWCIDNNVNAVWLRDELEKRSYFVRQTGAELAMAHRLFKGTLLAGALAKCFEFNYDRIDGSGRAHLTVVRNEELLQEGETT